VGIKRIAFETVCCKNQQPHIVHVGVIYSSAPAKLFITQPAPAATPQIPRAPAAAFFICSGVTAFALSTNETALSFAESTTPVTNAVPFFVST